MAERTLRQRLMETLRTGDETFEGLCYSLRVRRRELEAELRHVERTARSGGERLIVTPAVCETCGFVFRGRIPRHLQPPGRCPACKGERIADPLFRLEAAAS